MEVRGSNSLWRSYLLVRAWKQGPQTVDRFQNDFLRITEKNRFGVMLQSLESQIEFQQCKEGIFVNLGGSVHMSIYLQPSKRQQSRLRGNCFNRQKS